MNDGAPEQSMEDILASIKRVISADAVAARRLPPAPPARSAPPPDEDVLELGDPPPQLVSPRAEQQSRSALASLTALSIDPQGANNTLDGLVRELLRPMLKQWLDQNLPDVVERIVAREVARITGR